MKKRIYRNMILLVCASVLLTTLLLIMTFYMGFSKEVKSELVTTAEFLTATLELYEEQSEYLESLHLSNVEVRVTLIAPDGTVQYDSMITDENQFDNHANRGEIESAMRSGFGEEKRHSESVGKETYYYAIRLSSGNILRVAKTTANIYGVFVSVIPQSLLVIVIILSTCFIVAHRLARKILAPVKQFGLDKSGKIYDELAPFVKMIRNQKRQIGEAVDEVMRKSTVIDAITGNMKEGTILTNKDGTVLSANKSAMSILETKASPVEKNILEVTRNIVILENVKLALVGENHSVNTEIGGRIYHIVFSPVDDGVLILFLDITEKAKAENMRREFTANVSHELRTPLTTISGYTELLSNGMVQAEDVVGISKKMKSETDRLLALIEDIMRLAELDESEKEKSFESFDLTALIGEVVENLKLKADKHAIEMHIPKEVYTITANRAMLFEMVYNLVDNAIKYNKPHGSVTITLKQTDKNAQDKNTQNEHTQDKRIQDERIQNKCTQIEVRDTGIGVAKKYQERIFERFYRVDKSRSKEIGGTGLGLSIVKHIVAYHGGCVEVESEAGNGTVVRVFV